MIQGFHSIYCEDADKLFASTVAEMDEGMQVLDLRDHEEVKTEKKDFTSRTTAREQFAMAYFAKKEAARKAETKATKKRARKSSEVQTVLPFTIPQTEARLYIPPGTSIWRSGTRGAWCARVPPRRRSPSNGGVLTMETLERCRQFCAGFGVSMPSWRAFERQTCLTAWIRVQQIASFCVLCAAWMAMNLEVTQNNVMHSV